MATVTIEKLIKLSRDLVSKYHDDDPEFWDIISDRIDFIEKNGTLEKVDEDDEFSNDNLLYILSREYCRIEQINETQPLYELWYRASRDNLVSG